MNQLSITFEATFCNGWPRLKFYLDDALYQEFVVNAESTTINLPIDLLDGDHKLAIELWGKTRLNTIVKDGIIVKDQLVTLESIKVDGIQLPNFFKYIGIFDNGIGLQSPCMTWGQNGQWRWNFSTPLITWVLKNINEEEKKYFTRQQLGEDSGNEELAFKEINEIVKKINY